MHTTRCFNNQKIFYWFYINSRPKGLIREAAKSSFLVVLLGHTVCFRKICTKTKTSVLYFF